MTTSLFQQKNICRKFAAGVPRGTGGVVAASRFICAIIRLGAAAVAEQRTVVSSQWSVVSSQLPVIGRPEAARKERARPARYIQPQPRGRGRWAGGGRTDETAFCHPRAPKQEFSAGCRMVSG